MTSESTPWSWLTSARQRMVRSDGVAVGQGEVPAAGEHHVEAKVGRELVVELQRPVVEPDPSGVR